MKKDILIISHSDFDGILCAMLFETAYDKENVDWMTFGFASLDDFIKTAEFDLFKDYKQIIFTDINSPLLFERLKENKNWFVIDHHEATKEYNEKEGDLITQQAYYAEDRCSAKQCFEFLKIYGTQPSLLKRDYCGIKLDKISDANFKKFLAMEELVCLCDIFDIYQKDHEDYLKSCEINELIFGFYKTMEEFAEAFQNGRTLLNEEENKFIISRYEYLQNFMASKELVRHQLDNLWSLKYNKWFHVAWVETEDFPFLWTYTALEKILPKIEVLICFKYNGISLRSSKESKINVDKLLKEINPDWGGHLNSAAGSFCEKYPTHKAMMKIILNKLEELTPF